MQVFISYARENFDAADRLYKFLVAREINVWLDQYCLIGGQNWDKVIRQEIKNSTIFIALLSKVSVGKSGVVQKEFKLAEEHQHEKPSDQVYIVPVVLDECHVPEEFAKYHYVSLQTADGYEKVFQSIKSAMEIMEYESTDDTVGSLHYPLYYDDILPPVDNFHKKDFVYLSTLPGVFYRAPSPDDEPYCREGDAFKQGDSLFIIECNKKFIEYKAKEDGILGAFLAKNGEHIDKGSPIFLFYYENNRKSSNWLS